jgi:hypothetical protein
MLSFIPSAIVLGLAALVSLVLANTWPSPVEAAHERRAASRALAVAVVLQGIHFGEEALTGLPERLGPLFGLPPMSYSFFVLFNLTWLGIWLASIKGLASRSSGAFFAAWFLAIAGVLNGIAHPLLAVRTSGYFPGLVTSPFVGLASAWLGYRLLGATRTTSNG